MENWSFLVRLLFISRLLMTGSLQPCPARSLESGTEEPSGNLGWRGTFSLTNFPEAKQRELPKGARRKSPCPASSSSSSSGGSLRAHKQHPGVDKTQQLHFWMPFCFNHPRGSELEEL